MKDELDKIIDAAKNLELSAAEKQSIKTALLSHIEKSPVRAGAGMRLNIIKTQKPYLNILEALSLRPIFIKNMAIGLIIALIFSGGVSFAAESALPGDILYPVKVGINEEVRGALMFDPEAKAGWNARIVERRLEEAETLAADGKLNAEARAKIESNFEAHAARVRERIVKFETEKNLKAASDIESNFETSLRAHENILNRIANKKTESENEMRPIIERVKTKIRESKEGRTRLEANVEARTNGEFKAAAEGKINAAENKIAEAKRFIEQNKDSVNAETAAKAEAELKLAETAIADGKIKAEAEAYGEAFVLFQKALRIAQNAKLIMQAEKTFNIEIGIPPLHLRGEGQIRIMPQDRQEQKSGETEAESGASTEAEAESETRVKTNGGSTNVESGGKVRIDLGL